jgi:hypothetical protein
MHSHLNQLRAQEHIVDLRAAAERSRWAAGDRIELEDGRRLRVPPSQREDRDRFRGLFAGLAPETRDQRYSSPKPELSERELSHLVDLDHVRHEAPAAVDEIDDSFVAAATHVEPPRSASRSRGGDKRSRTTSAVGAAGPSSLSERSSANAPTASHEPLRPPCATKPAARACSDTCTSAHKRGIAARSSSRLN